MASNERPWYQSGFVAFGVGAVLLIVLLLWFRGDHEEVPLETRSEIVENAAGEPEFAIEFWHHYRGTLEDGRVTVKARGGLAPSRELTRSYGFDAWPPNEEHSISLQIPVIENESDASLRFIVVVEAKNAIPTNYNADWLGGEWTTPLMRVKHPFYKEDLPKEYR